MKMVTVVDGNKKQNGYFVVFVCVSRGNIFKRQFGNDNFKYESIFVYIHNYILCSTL